MRLPAILVITAISSGILIHLAVVLHRIKHPKPATGQLADAITRVAAGWTTLGLVIVAGAISYSHLESLAIAHGQTAWRASAFPLSVDGVEVVASLVLLTARREHRAAGVLPWLAVTIGALASIIANVAVAPNDTGARLIAGTPAVAFLIAVKLFLWLLDRPTPVQHTTPAATTDLDQHTIDHPVPDPVDDINIGTEPSSTIDPHVDPLPGTDQPNEQATVGHGTLEVSPGGGKRPPVDLMRRIPVQQDHYNQWRDTWHRLRLPDADTAQVAAVYGYGPRTMQFLRRAGEGGYLDSPTPPAIRMLALPPTPAAGANPSRPNETPPADTVNHVTQADLLATTTGHGD